MNIDTAIQASVAEEVKKAFAEYLPTLERMAKLFAVPAPKKATAKRAKKA